MNNNVKEKNSRQNKGITLIALIITIIVLLILAGVSILMLTGENGILNRAGEASETTKDVNEEEQVKLAVAEALTTGKGKITDETLRNSIGNMFGEAKKENLTGTGPWVYKGERGEYTINSNGTIEKKEQTKASIKINEFSINGTDVTTVTIPEGFVHVGGTIDEGYVISDNVEDEGKGVDADLKGNQFVWVPVKQNQRITLKVTSEEDITSIVITDPYGDDIVTVTDSEVQKSYSNEQINPTINGRYKLVVSTKSGMSVKFLKVFSLYACNSFLFDFLPPEGPDKEKYYANLDGDYTTDGYQSKLELELAKIYGFNSLEEMLGTRELGLTYENLQEWLEDYNYQTIEEALGIEYPQIKGKFIETEDYAEKVNAKGGFFIGRYEAGDSSTENERTTDSGEGTLAIQKNQYVYNYIEPEDALKKAQDYKKEVTSSLLTGAAWDRVLGWLYESGNKTIEEIGTNSKEWGNYCSDELIKTGTDEKTRTKNIYDIAGNVSELTTEECNSRVVKRGGGCFIPMEFGAFYSSERADYFSKYKYDGFRVALYQ